jgi:hypothetical protein
MKADEWKINHLIFGIFIGVIASYALLSLSYISSESAYMLIIFNFLFVSLTFPLNGTLKKKLVMLFVGNAIGLFWNYLFSLFAHSVTNQLGEFFNTLYIILSPFLNLVWIVSFWSLSLTALANSKNEKVGVGLDN